VNIPDRVVANCKAFKGPDAGIRVYNAAAVLKSVMGRQLGRRDVIAEDHCHRLGLDISAIAKEATGTGGGYLTPSPLHNEVIEQAARVGIARKIATVLPMTSDSLQVAKIAADSFGTVRYPDEASSISASDMEFSQIELLAKKRALFSYISNELNSDAVISFTDLLVRRFGFGLARNEDREFSLGDATSTYGGVVGLASAIGTGSIVQAATGHDTWPELTIADFVSCQGKLPEWAADGRECWVCSAAFYAIAMLGAAGGNAQGFDEDGNPLFLGKPVYFLSGMPTTATAATICCYYGNFEEGATIGDRIPFSFAVSEHVGFGSDTIACRGLSRYDINIHDAGDATNAGAIVTLKTAA
jgi:HK97 family phage major capsid protein